MSSAQTPTKDRGTLLAEERTDLAYKRSVIAAERTLMAWIRTALSMIGFGFTIYKFFQYMPQDMAVHKIAHPQAPRNLGLTLVALGTLSLIAAAWQHLHFLKELGTSPTQGIRSISFVVAVAVLVVGVLAFYGVLTREGPF
jgi:putative membrane protein